MENINNGAPMIKRTSASAHPYTTTKRDTVFTICALVIGFLFWEWSIYFVPTLGVFMFILLVVTTTFFYIRDKAKQNKVSLLLKVLTITCSLYFVVFDNTPLHFLMLAFITFTYVMWVMTASGTSIIKRLNGFILGDLINQYFVIPFSNFAAGFKALLNKGGRKNKTVLSLLIGLMASVPIFAAIIFLLSKADTGFQELFDSLFSWLNLTTGFEYGLELIIGIPIACYFFGFIYGNHKRRKTDTLSYNDVNRTFIKLHKIPKPAVFGPLVILNIIYLIFFMALGGYLFSAFTGDLPSSMTYAEYARRGFFELCGVSAINLGIIVFAYTCVKRKEREYPIMLKLLTAILSVFTVLLVSTAMSKMLLYIDSYGLTRLRVYTFCFMAAILFAFVLILLWHVKPFNLGKPLIIGTAILFLALAASNPDGQIAKYNIDSYEQGRIETLDTDMFYDLSDAAYPYIEEFAKTNDDLRISIQLLGLSNYYKDNYNIKEKYNIFSNRTIGDMDIGSDIDKTISKKSILDFNIQSYLASHKKNGLDIHGNISTDLSGIDVDGFSLGVEFDEGLRSKYYSSELYDIDGYNYCYDNFRVKITDDNKISKINFNLDTQEMILNINGNKNVKTIKEVRSILGDLYYDSIYDYYGQIITSSTYVNREVDIKVVFIYDGEGLIREVFMGKPEDLVS